MKNYVTKTRIPKPFDADFLVRLEQLHLIAKQMAVRSGSGQRRSLRLGDGLEFADHRAYAPGDDPRYIDWPYYGRMEKLLVRLFHQHSEGAVSVLLDRSGSMAVGQAASKFDYARRATAALAYVSMGGLDRVRVTGFGSDVGDGFSAGRNRRQILFLMEVLSEMTAEGDTNLARAIDQLVRADGQGDTVVLVSDLLGCEGDLDDSLARLRSRGMDVVVIHVIDPADARPPFGGAVLLEDAETARRRAVTVTDAIAKSYQDQWAKFSQGCRAVCASRSAVYVAAETDKPLDRLILHALRRAGVVGP